MDPSLPLSLPFSHSLILHPSFLSYVHNKECFGSSELRRENRFEIRIMCFGMKLELVIRKDSGVFFSLYCTVSHLATGGWTLHNTLTHLASAKVSHTGSRKKTKKSCVVVVRKTPPKKPFPYTQQLCKANPYLDMNVCTHTRRVDRHSSTGWIIHPRLRTKAVCSPPPLFIIDK